ncbi:uroporphyrinogen-III C-methyltransferase [Hyphomicrobium sp. MC1]|uniref:uroporphyrinogen-III C-methyltransferase n=1 Tax=Hyphomicrobium sp. (strain MC1) TaxID=717785 RepID=UPI00059E4D96|nr:uroporphyrinogen-III C-methyltransferase [Hyphomicrobium sp. MC1]
MSTLPSSFPPFPEISPGEVWLVGAGPGDPSHLTLLALHALQRANYVLYDALVDARILDIVNRGAIVRFVGKRGGKPSQRQQDINSSLIALARAGHRVVRLKGGDPFVFGRGAEEVAALSEAGIPYRVVPGITSGLAAASLAGIPATTRDTNHAIILATGHLAVDDWSLDHWAALARTGQPVIFYMAIANLPEITAAFERGGLSSDTPVAIVQSASTPAERVVETTLNGAVEAVKGAGIEPPAIVIIGKIVALRSSLRSLALADVR